MGKILALEGLICNRYPVIHSELATVSNEQDKQNQSKDDVKRGAEFWGLPENFANTFDQCTDYTVDTQYMKDHPENKPYARRVALGRTYCYDCLWEGDNKCTYAECHAQTSFKGYDLCPECDADIGEKVRSEKWPNCPWCGTKLNHSDFYHPPIKKGTDKDEDHCEHKRLYIKFAWAQNLEAESEWSSIFKHTSKTYHLRMTKGGEWQNYSLDNLEFHVRRVVCLDCNELLYDRGTDSWSIVPECMKQIINDSAEKFMSKNFANMKKNGLVIVYTTKEHIAKWPNVEEADRVK